MFGERGFGRAFIVALAGAAAVVALLVTAGGAGARSGWGAPSRPPHDIPSANGLAGGRERAAEVKSWGGGSWNHSKVSGGSPTGAAAPGAVGASTLVLYDTTGDYGWLGELYAQYAGNLVSRFGTWKAEPVTSYQAGQIGQYTATIYIGSTYNEPLPTAFLTDVSTATRPVVWIYDNIWELSDQLGASAFASQYGWMWSQFDTSSVSHVEYNGVTLTRDGADNQAGIMDYSSVDPSKADVLAWAVRDSDGSKFPWAIRSGELTYVGENPFVYTSETDRVLAFDDMLYDVLDPSAPTQHRALLRLEDISLDDDPATLMQTAEYLYSQHIPYGFEFTPVYTDPSGFYNNGVPQTVALQKHTQMAETILYMESHGGTLVAHGLTHQYSNIANPFTAVTGDDAEFYRLIENPDHTIDYAGPVPNDSYLWAAGRMLLSKLLFAAAGVGAPEMWTFPDYAASVPDYQAAAALFPVRWERALYFGGDLSGGTIDYSHVIGETFPWVVRDVYGSVVLPENLGDYSPIPFYAFPAHTVDDILAAGSANLAVRNGFASFFYHPYLGLTALEQVVNGLRAEGYTFADPASVAATG